MQDKHTIEQRIQEVDNEIMQATLAGNERILRQLQTQRRKLEALFEGDINL